MRKAYTLVEILVVLVIFFLLGSVVIQAIESLTSKPATPAQMAPMPSIAQIEVSPIEIDGKDRYYVKIKGQPFVITYNGPKDITIEVTNMTKE